MGRLILSLLFVASLAAAPVPKVAKAKLTAEGTWEVTARQNNGQPINGKPREFWVLGNDTFDIFQGLKDESELSDLKRRTSSGTWETPDLNDPTAFDLQDGSIHDICRMHLDGDVLHIAIAIGKNRERPAEGKPGQGVAYIKLKRVDATKLKAK